MNNSHKSLTNFELPKFRKGNQVVLMASGQRTTIEKIHLDSAYGYLYKLKDVIGAFGEKELALDTSGK